MAQGTDQIPRKWRARVKSILSRWARPLVAVEHGCEWLAHRLSRWALLRVLDHLEKFSVLVAVILFILQIPRWQKAQEEQERAAADQKKAKQYQAWQVINSARGAPGDGGRKLALQDLVKDGISLAAADLGHAQLMGLHLTKADMQFVNLEGAQLHAARFISCNLEGANLNGVRFMDGALLDSNLSRSVLSNANLFNTSLEGVYFNNAKLNGANLNHCWVSKTAFLGADLRGANLSTILDWTNITTMQGANIYGLKGAPDGFVAWAKAQGACEAATDEEWRPKRRPRPGLLDATNSVRLQQE